VGNDDNRHHGSNGIGKVRQINHRYNGDDKKRETCSSLALAGGKDEMFLPHTVEYSLWDLPSTVNACLEKR
jgi:hypothetical protein